MLVLPSGAKLTGKLARILAASALVVACATAWASETTTYEYDELGRLKSVKHTGTINDNVTTTIQYDPAGNRSNYSVAGSDGVTFFSINDPTVTEGSSLSFTVTKLGVTSSSYSVNYATANGSAHSGSDYNTATGTLTFTATQTTRVITVSTINDSAPEPTENLYVDLSNPSGGATISEPRGVGTITDND